MIARLSGHRRPREWVASGLGRRQTDWESPLIAAVLTAAICFAMAALTGSPALGARMLLHPSGERNVSSTITVNRTFDAGGQHVDGTGRRPAA